MFDTSHATRKACLTAASTFAVAVLLFFPAAQAFSALPLSARLHAERHSPGDLEISGNVEGVPAGAVRFLSREDLLALPQVTYTVTDDPNFKKPTEVSGVSLEEIAKALAAAPDSDIVIAVCNDHYQAHYPRAYLAAHHPLLVLTVNGQPPERWPKDSEGYGLEMGPYMISHRAFTPGFKILGHDEEAQIPWGVVRLEFRSEKEIYGPIAPRGANAGHEDVQAGYRIAQQNCLRCHNMGEAGGRKARHPWLVLSAWATAAPDHFAAYVHDPRSQNPHAEMPGFPAYDSATMQALLAYFQTFQPTEKP